jgi:hypothetical protein
VHKSCSLIHKTVFGVKNFGVSSVDDILNNVGVLIHLGLGVILFLGSALDLLLLIFILLLLDSIDSHHIFFADLVITVPHCGQFLIFKKLKFL